VFFGHGLLLSLGGQNPVNGFFQLDAVQVHIPAAAKANHADVAANASDPKQAASAGVILFQLQAIADRKANDFHKRREPPRVKIKAKPSKMDIFIIS
jgi:hypothetical protein